ncbi:MAG: Tm-1-like ATP-binding domain-containing protein, partial [Gemmataceae bacterium]
MSIAMKKEASKAVYCIATLDTKGPDAQFVANLLKSWGHRVVLVDVGTQHAPTVKPDLPREVLADSDLFASLSRAEAIEIMSAGLTKYLVQEEKAGRVAAVLGMGGSGGTALICPAFRELPIGLPKIMISNVA